MGISSRIIRVLIVSAMIAVFLPTQQASALPTAQDPSTEAIIRIEADGIAPFDGATADPIADTNPGLDGDGTNGIVRNFDLITYNVEVSLNDANDTNVLATVRLNNKAKWSGVPPECKTVANGLTITPDSTINDTTGDGLEDTLTCNLGDQTEGSKLFFKPVAQAAGNNKTLVQASVLSSSDNNTNLTGVAGTQGAGPVETQITASFGIGINKSVQSLALEDEILYRPAYYQTAIYGAEGKVIDWHISLNYAAGSEAIQDNGDGTQSFTITDTWVGTHANCSNGTVPADCALEGDNANGDFDDQIIMLGSVSGDVADSCALLNAGEGLVTCTQAAPGGPITIQLDNIPVSQQPLAKVHLKMFVPYSPLFRSNGFSTVETYDIENTATLTAWGGSGTMVTSQTGSTDPGPETSTKDWLLSASTAPGGLNFFKTFDGAPGAGKSGQRAGARGETIETTIGIQDFRAFDTRPGVCDTLDTTVLEFGGAAQTGQKDGSSHGAFFISNLPDGSTIMEPQHGRFNPVIQSYKSGDSDATFVRIDGPSNGTTVEYSSLDYGVTGDDHWNATCEDDLDGDGNYDWVSDYNTLPGGAADVVRVRLIWDKEYSSLEPQIADGWTFLSAQYSFDLVIKDTAPIGSELPNTASTYDEINIRWRGNWGGTTDGLRPSNGSPNGNVYWNVQDDPTNALFSYNTLNADRVLVLPVSMSIRKLNADSSGAGPFVAGDTASFVIDPFTGGSNQDAVEMTFTDVIPAELEYVGDDCASVYAAVGLTCTSTVVGQTVTWVVPDYQVGDNLPAFNLDTSVRYGTAAGTYENDVSIDSDFATFTDDSHCDDAVDRFGVVTATAIAACQRALVRSHSDSAGVLVLAESGVEVRKSVDGLLVEPYSDFVFELFYANLGGSDLGAGHLIDVLPFNGDGDEVSVSPFSPERFNGAVVNPNTSTQTADPHGRAYFQSVAGDSGETFEYTTDVSTTVDHRPCHPDNWPVGDSLGSGNAVLDGICGEGLIDPATNLNNAAQAGTGATSWLAGPIPAGDTVTAFRASLPAFPAGDPDRALTLTLNSASAFEDDLFCNNFGVTAEITLDIISNDVCIPVVAGTIGDTIWDDINNDGDVDAGEAGIPNVTVILLDENGDPVVDHDGDPITAVTSDGTLTDSAGNVLAVGEYLFENVPSGSYRVEVDTSTLPGGMVQTFDANGPLDFGSDVVLFGPNNPDTSDPGYDPANPAALYSDVDDDDTHDFGARQLYRLGNLVFFDADDDGVFEPADGDSGIDGVEVELWKDIDGDGVFEPAGGDSAGLVAEVVTDADGKYWFTGVERGNYFVVVPETVSAVGANAAALDDLFGSSSVTSGGDNNNDGTPAAGYDGVSGLIVVDGTAMPTLENPPDGAPGDDETEADTATLAVEDEASDLTFDLSFSPRFRVGNLIWEDFNNDGIADDGEPGIEGVLVQLLNNSGVVAAETVTDSNGKYVFDNLVGGDYTVVVPKNQVTVLPLTPTPTAEVLDGSLSSGTAISSDETDNDNNGVETGLVFSSGVITLGDTGGEPTDEVLRVDDLTDDDDDGFVDDRSDYSVDFGFFRGFRLGNQVWLDEGAGANLNNGVADADETGLNGVTLELWEDTDGDGLFDPVLDTLVDTVISGGDGNYWFENVPEGGYFISVPEAANNAALTGLISSDGQTADPAAADNDDDGAPATGYNAVSALISVASPTSLGETDGTTAAADAETAANTATDTYPDLNSELAIDFGFIETPAYRVGSQLWNDVNNNGTFDSGETPIEGALVQLWRDVDGDGIIEPTGDDAAGFITETSTDTDGLYSFENLIAGEYAVIIPDDQTNATDPTIMDGFNSSTNGEETNPNDDVDNNDNGINNTPVGVASGIVTLGDAADAESEPTNEETFDSSSVDGDTGTATIPDGRSNNSVDFGFFKLEAGNQVFYDVDGDGVYDIADGDYGMPGVTVQLFLTSDLTTPIDSIATDPDGLYLFSGLDVGVDYVIGIPAANFVTGAALDGVYSSPGDDPAADGNDGTDDGIDPATAGGTVFTDTFTLDGTEPLVEDPNSNAVLADGTSNLTIDFGFTGLSLGNRVWLDTGTENGAYDVGEPTPTGITVQLLSGGIIIDTATTDSNGNYLFTGLTPGDYQVQIPAVEFASGGLLEGYVSSTTVTATDPDDDVDDDSNGTQTSAAITEPVTLAYNSEPDDEVNVPAGHDDPIDVNSNLTVDFGFMVTPTYRVGNLIWNDVNENGVAETGEPGISGVLVQLLDNTNTIIAETVTDSDGKYEFDDLPAGDYTVIIPKTQTATLLLTPLPTAGVLNNKTPAPNPLAADGTDNDNNNIETALAYSSGTITLGDAAGEPTDETLRDDDPTDDDNDAHLDDRSDFSVDFGFVTGTLDLALIKQLDTGTNTGNVNAGTDVTFTITVYNQGDLDATQIKLVDYIPAGLTLNDSNWTDNGDGTATLNTPISTLAASGDTTIDITYTVGNLAAGTVINSFAEIAGMLDGNGDTIVDVDSTPDTTPGDPATVTGDDADDDNILGDAKNVAGDDEDDHDVATITIDRFDLALINQISDGTNTANIISGNDVTFTTTVYNQGNIDATNIQIVNYIPTGFTLNDPNWTDNGDGTATLNTPIPAITAGNNTTIDITYTVAETTAGTVINNYAEIASALDGNGDPVTDADSTPDTTPGDPAAATAGDADDDNTAEDGKGTPGDDEDDHDVATVVVDRFDLALINQISDGTNTANIVSGNDVTFTMTVYNQGNIDANNIQIVNYIPTGFTLNDAAWTDNGDGTATLNTPIPAITASNNTTINIIYTVTETTAGTIINNYAEIASALDGNGDPVTDADSTADTTPGDPATVTAGDADDDNTAEDAKNVAGDDEDDHDVATVTVGTFNLAISLELADGSTSAAVSPGDDVTFTATITNEGTTEATTINLIDYIPAGLTLNDPNWTDNGDGTATLNTPISALAAGASTTVNITFAVDDDIAVGTVIDNRLEISSALDANGNGIADIKSSDDQDTATITVGTFDLALTTQLSDGTNNGTYNPGDQITFNINVYNQGTIDATNIKIVDYIPAGLTLNDPAWTDNGDGTATLNTPIDTLAAGTNTTITIKFTIDADVTDGTTINNAAEILEASNPAGTPTTDIDSTADNTNNDNQPAKGGDPTDDQTNGNPKTTPGDDEDDHDIATVTIITNPAAINNPTTRLAFTGNTTQQLLAIALTALVVGAALKRRRKTLTT